MNREKRMVKIYSGNGSPFKTIKTNRNDPCQCGSGKKSKKCCGTETKFYHSKVKPKTDLEEMIENNSKEPVNTDQP
ncbi:MAG: SEC-C metal-binding domain-containing protein [Bacteroidia bacterium]|nr:SEC-C metal-binding domain-containing protein [Bacteroidia bacterium]